MTETATKTEIKVGAVFGYRKVVEVTSRTVSFINLNGRKPANGRRRPIEERTVTVTRGEFRALIGD